MNVSRDGPHVILPSDVRTKIAKRAACLMLLIPLVLFEMYLCTAFLPMRWQRAINDSLPDMLPKSHDWTPITHPLLSEEIESVLREHVGLRITVFAITVALLFGNAWLIRRVWRFSLDCSRATTDTSTAAIIFSIGCLCGPTQGEMHPCAEKLYCT
jgi:hypothetical protein